MYFSGKIWPVIMKPQVNYIGIEVNTNAKLPRHILKLLNLPTFIPYLKELFKGI